MTRTAGAPIGCQRPSRFWGLGCPKIYHEVEDTLVEYLIQVNLRLWQCDTHIARDVQVEAVLLNLLHGYAAGIA
ncbi:hypothetical protein, partial [Thiolapillus sp.]|uniref:hypothetical protein n=1 Tax=Thiolapillus sp. TaxID=2017437 RepID=UPI003AF53D48